MTCHFARDVFPGIISLRGTRRERVCRETDLPADPRRKLFDNPDVMPKNRTAPPSRIGTAYEQGSSVTRPNCQSLAGLPSAIPSRGTACKPLFCKWPRGGQSSTTQQSWPH